MPIVNHNDVATRRAARDPLDENLGDGTPVPIEIPQAPALSDQRIVELRQTGIHLAATPATMWSKCSARAATGQTLDTVSSSREGVCHVIRRHHHQFSRVGVQANGMALIKHASDDGGGFRSEVAVDDEEGRNRPLIGHHVEQPWRRVWIRAVVESEIHRWQIAPRGHAPQSAGWGNSVEEKWERRHVRERHDPEASGNQHPKHHVLASIAAFLLCTLSLTACMIKPVEQRAAQAGDWSDARRSMVDRQLRGRGITSPRVLTAMEVVPRHRFVPSSLQRHAYDDGPLPIGYEQTISQPYIVAYMTEALALPTDAKVLEIGTGSGYQAAVLGEIAREVFTIEIVAELAARSKTLLAELGYTNIVVKTGDGYRGWPEHAPFDGIIVTAAPDHIPSALIDQLAVGARLIIPVGHFRQAMTIVTNEPDGTRTNVTLPVRFVPMTGEALSEHPSGRPSQRRRKHRN